MPQATSPDTTALARTVVRVVQTDATGQANRQPCGTAFFVTPTHLATACHVIRYMAENGITPHILIDGQPVPAQVAHTNPDQDIAILKIAAPMGTPAPLVVGHGPQHQDFGVATALHGFPIRSPDDAMRFHPLPLGATLLNGTADSGGACETFQIRSGVEEGFSGGPLIRPGTTGPEILAMVRDGGEFAGHSRFVAGTVLARWLLDCAIPAQIVWIDSLPPRSAPTPWAIVLTAGPGMRQLRLRSGSPTPVAVTFRLLSDPLTQQPVWLSDHLAPCDLGTPGAGSTALLGMSWEKVQTLLADLDGPVRFQVPTVDLWIAAMTEGDAPGLAVNTAKFDRRPKPTRGRPTVSGIHEPPPGCIEYVLGGAGQPSWVGLPTRRGDGPRHSMLTNTQRPLAPAGFRLCVGDLIDVYRLAQIGD